MRKCQRKDDHFEQKLLGFYRQNTTMEVIVTVIVENVAVVLDRVQNV